MPILAQMAAALGKGEDQLQQELGLESAEDMDVAQRLLANATRVAELQAHIARALGVPEGADPTEVINAVDALQQDARRREADEVVGAAVQAGRITPAQRDYFVRGALSDPEGTRAYLEGLPAMLAPHGAGFPTRTDSRPRELTDAERSVCCQLGLSEESFLAVSQ